MVVYAEVMDMQAREPLVADAMSADPIVVDLDASLEEADRLLRSTYIIGIPVVDRDGVLVGVISHAHLTAFRFALSSSGDPEVEVRADADEREGTGRTARDR